MIDHSRLRLAPLDRALYRCGCPCAARCAVAGGETRGTGGDHDRRPICMPTGCRSFRRRSPTRSADTRSSAPRPSPAGTRRGAQALVLTRFANTNQVHEVRFPGGDRRQLTFFPERITAASWPRHSGEYFVFTRDRGGDEFRQIFRTDVATGVTTMVSDGGRSQNDLGPWSHSGDRMAYDSTRRNGADRDIYIVDPKRSRDRPAPADPRRRRLGPPRLVARRHEARGARVRLDQRELSVGRGRGDRREDARHAEGEG